MNAPFDLWPDCCRRANTWSRKPPRLFACPTCGEVVHTKRDYGAVHHQRVRPGSVECVTAKCRFRPFTEADRSEFGMYVGEEIEAHRGEPYWPHYRINTDEEASA